VQRCQRQHSLRALLTLEPSAKDKIPVLRLDWTKALSAASEPLTEDLLLQTFRDLAAQSREVYPPLVPRTISPATIWPLSGSRSTAYSLRKSSRLLRWNRR
jgi:hypothetical protein